MEGSLKVQKTCRLCDESCSKMYSIFEKNVFDIEIINMIKDCLPILIYENDPLSKFICYSCNECLNMFGEFKKSCLEITQKQHQTLQANVLRSEQENTFLHKLLSQSNDEPMEEQHVDEDQQRHSTSRNVEEEMKFDPGANESPSTSNKQSVVPFVGVKEEDLPSNRLRFAPERCPIGYRGTVPYFGEKPLAEVHKNVRHTCYTSVMVNDREGKLCMRCRYIFKDDTAIEAHYMELRCLYTCQYCGKGFNRSRRKFQRHIDFHIHSGHNLNLNVIMAGKGNCSRKMTVDCLGTFEPQQSAHLPPANTMKLRERSLLIKREPLESPDSPPHPYSKRKRAESRPAKNLRQSSSSNEISDCLLRFQKRSNVTITKIVKKHSTSNDSSSKPYCSCSNTRSAIAQSASNN